MMNLRCEWDSVWKHVAATPVHVTAVLEIILEEPWKVTVLVEQEPLCPN